MNVSAQLDRQDNKPHLSSWCNSCLFLRNQTTTSTQYLVATHQPNPAAQFEATRDRVTALTMDLKDGVKLSLYELKLFSPVLDSKVRLQHMPVSRSGRTSEVPLLQRKKECCSTAATASLSSPSFF